MVSSPASLSESSGTQWSDGETACYLFHFFSIVAEYTPALIKLKPPVKLKTLMNIIDLKRSLALEASKE